MRDTERHAEPTPGEFAINVREDGYSTLIEISGELDLAHSTEAEDAIGEAEKRKGQITVDLTGLTFLDSIGVAILLMMRGRDRHDGENRMTFIPPTSDDVLMVLVRTGTDKELF